MGVGSGAPEKFFDVVLRNVELLCILDSGAGRYYSNCNQDFHDIGTYRLVLPIFYYCIIMLSNVASTPLSCDRLLPSLFSVHCSQLHKDVAVFFDLEKAYDTTWKQGIMKDMFDAGLRGRLPLFIQGFLQNRQFQVRLGSHFSNLFTQEMGVPQGGVLSVTLFALKINSIVKNLSPGVECSLYVDDFLICYRSKFIHTIERHLQHSLYKLQVFTN